MRRGVLAVGLWVVVSLLAVGAEEPASDPGSAAGEASAAAAAEQAPRAPRPALQVPLAPRSTLLDIARAGPRRVAVGIHGDIVVSEDGQQWRQVDSPVDVLLTRVGFRDAVNGWALGYDGAVLATRDGGLSWTLQRWVPDKGPLYDLLFIDDSHGIAVGSYGTLLQTADGGSRWEPLGSDISTPGVHFNAITRLADGTLFIAGERGMMARSTDNGGSWSLLDSPYKGSMFGALPQGDHGVLVFGLRGNIYRSDDVRQARTTAVDGWDEFDRTTATDPAKLGWRRLDNPSPETLLRGHALPDGGALLTGVNGVLLRVAARGDTVTLLRSEENETLSGLVPEDGKRWTAAGLRGIRPLELPSEGQP